MEFCEKSTLRDCIDAGLYLDMDRVWRLFREIIEGLVHIHEQVSRNSPAMSQLESKEQIIKQQTRTKRHPGDQCTLKSHFFASL